MRWTPSIEWRNARAGTATFGVINAAFFAIYLALDYLPDTSLDYPTPLYYFGGGALIGLVRFIGTDIFGQRAARADMVRVHGEATVAQYERSR